MRVLACVIAVVLLVAGCGSGPPAPESITLTFVRHAQSQGNASGLIDTSVPGPGLSEEGRRQAQAAADALRGKEFDGVYASNMVRTQQTAAPLAADLDEQVEVLPGLREIEAGWFEDKPESQVASTYFLAPEQWLDGNLSAAIPGSVTGKEFNDRFTAAVAEIYDSGDKNPVAFAHSGSIMLWTLLNVANPNDGLLLNRPLPNTGRVVIEGNPVTGWQLVNWDGITDFGP
ncbi:histidine phosphatase family protein [Mycobacterium sp. ACS4331]|uniref:histidine phosphatase family protein n=1 Tax=Mycobacterium sp. ACS4331 TaxID=1834121 RepID=UPI000800B793|nr:histidine phosphatase family protein [Mycobacterium sp. ACS4331]OBF14217.1 histidine phosphatase family protein [Mycobacterium sp. ACS4331]